MTYLETTQDFYRQAAETPDAGLCCTCVLEVAWRMECISATAAW